jgi:hypothetical protein
MESNNGLKKGRETTVTLIEECCSESALTKGTVIATSPIADNLKITI